MDINSKVDLEEDLKFWTMMLDETAIIIDGHCYHTGPEDDSSHGRGFGGNKFLIMMTDEKHPYYDENCVVETTNLWHNGKVPDWCDVKDNAKFIRSIKIMSKIENEVEES